MWRISAGGASRGLFTTLPKAGLRDSSPPTAGAFSPNVETPFGQQAQSKQSPAQSLKGSSHMLEHVAESPNTADAMKASKSVAARVAQRRVTQRL